MARTLIVYASREGQTGKIAGTIARELESSGAEVFLVNAADIKSFETFGINRFDKVVLGASLHAGHIENELVSFIGACKTALQQKPCWFFLVLMAAATPDIAKREKDLQAAESMVRKQVLMALGPIEMIAGALM